MIIIYLIPAVFYINQRLFYQIVFLIYSSVTVQLIVSKRWCWDYHYFLISEIIYRSQIEWQYYTNLCLSVSLRSLFSLKFILLKYSWFKMCSFILYSKLIHLYEYTHFFIFFSIMVYHKILTIVPCAILYELVVYPSCIYQFVLLILNSQAIPFPFPLLLGSHNLSSISVSLSHRHVQLCHVLDSTCKWYHMVFVFLFLTNFT